MKTIFLSFLIVSTMGMSGYVKVTKSEVQKQQSVSLQLSDEQMAIVNGKGCNFWEWALIGLLGVQCASGDVFACIALPISIAACADTGGGGGQYTSDCPNGGSAEEESGCDQRGGIRTGQPQNTYGSNMVCCADSY
jgi:hypothetical protein